jgi:hypothetical protein
MGVGVVVGVGVLVGVEVGVGVCVLVGVRVNVGVMVSVGPNNLPGLHPLIDITKTMRGRKKKRFITFLLKQIKIFLVDQKSPYHLSGLIDRLAA